MNYYNENDPKAAAWLRELIRAGLIPDGHVDERSICDVRGGDLEGFVQCHFFAGIGGWSYALELAGWPADRPVWTGSCPCQPLSSIGQRRGEADPRHLWPEFYRLIAERHPYTVIGEQVASPDGIEWVDGVSLDLEELDYAVASVDMPAACIDLPQIRQRLFWVADANGQRLPHIEGWKGSARQDGRPLAASTAFADGIFRRIPEPGFCPVVDGLSAIPFAVRGYGNAIVPQVAAEFVKAFIEATTGELK